jgi:hypothetical protein
MLRHRHEFAEFSEAIYESPLFKDAIAEFDLPEGFVVTLDPVRSTRAVISKGESFYLTQT